MVEPAPAPIADRQAPCEVVAFVLVANFSMIAFSTALEPLRLANRLSGREIYRWLILSKNGEPVRASNGTTVLPDGSLDRVGDGATAHPPRVVVCGGYGADKVKDPVLFAWLRKMDRLGSPVGAVCTGAYILARAGLMDGHRGVIHWEDLPAFRENFPEVEVSSDLFEVSGRRFTSSGGTSSLDLMLHLIAETHGAKLATAISEVCLLDRMRGPHDRQRLPLRVRLGIHHPKLIDAIEMMEANVEEPLSQEMLAGYVGLSRRQLERLFRKHLGRTPAQYYLETRLSRARHLLFQTEMPIMDVALACGFVSPSHFSTCYRHLYGRTPRDERLAISAAAVAMAEEESEAQRRVRAASG